MHCVGLVTPFPWMESWSCVSGGKGLVVSDEMISPSCSLGRARSKNAPISWDLGTPTPTPSFGHDMMVVPAHDATVASDGLGEMGFQELVPTQYPYGNVVSDRVDGAKGADSLFGSLSSFSGMNVSSSNFEHSTLAADCQDSLLIDLKLGRFLPDMMDGHSPKLPQGIPDFSLSESSIPQKRNRSGGLNSPVAYCQAYGCNKDLSSCKDYHKKHKICEVHSKTPTVIVNGIEQRFCQQCSRFHLLAEFDESKRSCRKRLAGHNKRRRKPQLSVQAGRIGRLLQPYGGMEPAGNAFHPNSLRSSSSHCQDTIASNLPGCIKVEDGSMFGPLLTVPLSKGHLDLKPHCSYERPFNFFNDGVGSTSSGIFTNNGDQCQRDQGRRNYASHSSFRGASIGAEDFTIFDTAASAIQALSGLSESGCALSLLSSQSHSSSSHSSGIPMALPRIATSGIDIKLPSNKASFKLGESSTNSLLISDSVNFEFPEGALQEPDFTNIKNGSTINLLELSSHLHRLDDHRHFI